MPEETSPQPAPASLPIVDKKKWKKRVAVWTLRVAFAYSVITAIILFFSIQTYFKLNKQFSTMNEPLLMASNIVGISNDTIGRGLIVTARIINLSKRAILIDSAKIGLRFMLTDSNKIFIDTDSISVNRNSYILSDQSTAYIEEKYSYKVSGGLKGKDTMTLRTENSVVFGAVYYKSYLDNSPMCYLFSMTVDPKNSYNQYCNNCYKVTRYYGHANVAAGLAKFPYSFK